MKRISTPTRAIDIFGPGKHGFKNGDLANGIQPTKLEADWFNQVQEELARLIEGGGIALDGNVKTQILQAIRRMAGGYVRTVTAGNTVLTADDAGLVLINAAAGAVTIALPRANVLKALPIAFRRIDPTGNTVTISVAGTGADVIDAGDSEFFLASNDTRKVVSDGVSSWHSDIGVMTQSQGDVRYILASNEVGKIVSFMRSTAPEGYIKANGLTIGSAGSGATNRANSDTLALFLLFWDEFDNTLLQIQTSAGAPTIRGASAMADWTANKRMPVFDRRGKFGRGWDDGRGLDTGRELGTDQAYETASHEHTASTDAAGDHTHSINDAGHTHAYSQTSAGTAGGAEGGNRNSVGASSSNTSSSSTGIGIVGAGNHSHVITVGATGGAETRPTNIAELVCIKL